MIGNNSRRKFLFEAVTVSVGLSLFGMRTASAQAVRLLTYQGRLVDAQGLPANVALPMTFRIIDGNGLALWTEAHASVAVSNGFFSIRLGEITPLSSGLFDGPPMDAHGPVRLLEVNVNGETLSPNLRITSASSSILTAAGQPGPAGAPGPQGAAGIGSQGAAGVQGIGGPQGFQGSIGQQGNSGSGAQGVSGERGFQGYQGYQGYQGVIGQQGGAGTGAQGATGVQGFQGVVGDVGAQGPMGFQGITGPQGVIGPQQSGGFQGVVLRSR